MITFSMCDLGELSAFVPPPPGDLLEAAQIEVVVAAQQNELPPMLTDLPPAGLKKVIARKPIKGNQSPVSHPQKSSSSSSGGGWVLYMLLCLWFFKT